MSQGHMEPAEVVAYDLGRCQGHRAYQRVAWFFPQFGERFTRRHGRRTCTSDSG